MANPGFVVPVGVQNKEGFHGLRRTTEGLLYYTKVNKDSGEVSDGQNTIIDYFTKDQLEILNNINKIESIGGIN